MINKGMVASIITWHSHGSHNGCPICDKDKKNLPQLSSSWHPQEKDPAYDIVTAAGVVAGIYANYTCLKSSKNYLGMKTTISR